MTRRLIALTLLVALLLAGCQSAPLATPQTPEETGMPTDNTFHAGTDSPIATMDFHTTSQIAESEHGYYIAAEHFLVYVDKLTKVAAPMCRKPGCLHQNEPDKYVREQCDAYFHPGMQFFAVFYDNGYVYVAHQSGYLYDGAPPDGRWKEQITLTRMNPDGSDRVELFSFEEFDLRAAAIHRGRFYYLRYNAEVYSYPLDQINAQPELAFYEEHIIVYNFFAYGDRLYIQTESDLPGNCTIKILDLTSREVTVVPFLDNMNYYSNAAICGDRLILCGKESYQVWEERYYTDKVVDSGLYTADLDGTNVKSMDIEKYGNLWGDGQYIYQVVHREDLDTGKWYRDYLAVYNKDMQEVARMGGSKLELEGFENGGAQFIPMQDGTIFLHGVYGPEDEERDYIYLFAIVDREDIAAGKLDYEIIYSYGQSEYGFRNR